MGEDALDALLKGRSGGRRSRLPGLKVADIFTMPPEQQSLVNWLMRHYEAQPETIADNIHQNITQVHTHLKDLIEQGLLKTVEKPDGIYYRVKLAPKSGRQMPKDIWQVLDSSTQQANVFISYSRRNKEFVQELHSALEATGREVWVDWENIPVAVDWWQEIQLGIELADTFVFILSPDSVASQVCGQEIEEALKHNKRLVPVVCQDVPPNEVHPELARLNWIFLRSQDDFEKGFKGLLEALDQDLDYVRTHTRILVRALEWDRNGRDSSYLLRGADLDRANRYLAQGKDQGPRPTALHHQYVLASAEREAAEREIELERQKSALAGQRRWLQLVTAASILAVAMGLSSWGLLRQAQRAQKLAEESQIRALNQSAQALFLADQRFEALLSATQAGRLLQSLDAEQRTPELESRVLSALQQTLFWVQERNRLEGHTGTVWQVAFSPDEKTLASVSADGTVRLWGLDGSHLGVLKCNGKPLLDLDYAPDGKRIIAVDSDGSLFLWSSEGRRLQEWRAHTQPTRAADFSPSGQLIATASEDGTVKIWQPEGKLVKTLSTSDGGVHALLWTANNQLIAGDERGIISVWNAAFELIGTFDTQKGAITALDISPDGQFLAAVGDDRQVNLFNLADARAPVKTFAAHAGPIYNVRFTLDGKKLITVGDDKVIRVWQLDGQPSGMLVGHRGLVAALAVSPDGKQIATSGGDRAVRLWDLEWNKLHVVQTHDGPVNTVDISPDSRLVAAGGTDAKIDLLDEQGTLLRSLTGHTGAVNSLTFSADGNLLASASADGTARVWQALRTAQPTAVVLQGHVGSVNGVAFHPQGEMLATVGEDHTLRLWKLDGTPMQSLDAHRDGVFGVLFSPDGRTLVTTSWDYNIRLWDVKNIAATPITLEGHSGWVLDAGFSPDGSLLATASYDNTVKLWQVSEGKLLRTLEGHEDGVLSVTFSPDGQRIITASNDNTIRVWDLDGYLLTTLAGHTQGVRDVKVAPNGKFLVSGSSDSRTLIWEGTGTEGVETLLQSSCSWLQDYLGTNTRLTPETRALCEMPEPDGET